MASVPNLKFIQTNLDHSQSGTKALVHTMDVHQIDIAVACDPYVTRNQIPNIPNRHMRFAASENPKLVIFGNNAQYDWFPIVIHTHIIALRATSSSCQFTLIGVYIPPHDEINFYLNLITNCITLSRTDRIIITGDFNAKSTMWGNQVSDSRGAALVQLLSQHSLTVLNDPNSLPTFETDYSRSWIDVTAASHTLSQSGFHWSILDGLMFTDHRLIIFYFSDQQTHASKKLTFAGKQILLETLKNSDWLQKASQADLISGNALDLTLEKFYKMYNDIAQANLRKVKNGARKPNSWWTTDLQRERSQVRRLRKSYQQAFQPEIRQHLHQIFSRARARYRRNIRTAQETALKSFCTNYSKKAVFGIPYKLAFQKLRPPFQLPPLCKENGQMTDSVLESAELLLHTQVSKDDISTDLPIHTNYRKIANAPSVSRHNDTPFTIAEIQRAISISKVNSAPGIDALTICTIKALFSFHPKFFLFIFNTSLRLGHFPQVWKYGKIIFIPKPGRPLTDTSSYRPIVMNSLFGKILERLLNSRLYHFLYKNNLIQNNQYGFTAGRSAVVALYALKERLYYLKQSKTPAILISIDFKGAFDSVWHPLVLTFLQKHGCPANLFNLLRNFLSNRKVIYTSNTGSVTENPTLGSPQGSPISPLLWNIVISGLLKQKFPSNTLIQAYADDTILLIWGKTKKLLEQSASQALTLVQDWSNEAKVTVSTQKSFYIIFPNGTPSLRTSALHVSMANARLQNKDTLKILGVIFDFRLGFKEHVDHIRDKLENMVPKITAYFQLHYSGSGRAAKILYRQVVLPSITYAAPVWWTDIPDVILNEKIKSAQRLPLIALTGAYRTTRTAALQVLCKAPPLQLELDRLCAEFSLFTLRQPTCYGRKIYSPDNVQFPADIWTYHPAHRFSHTYKKLSTSDAHQITLMNALHIYTDGSYSQLSAGAAFVVIHPTRGILAVRKYKVLNASGPYCAELVAFTEALEHI